MASLVASLVALEAVGLAPLGRTTWRAAAGASKCFPSPVFGAGSYLPGSSKPPRLSLSSRTETRSMAKGKWVNWVVKGEGPGPRSSIGVSSTGGGTVFVLGGEKEARVPAGIAQVFRFNVSSLEWSKISPQEGSAKPSNRNAHAQAALGDEIYVFGGRQGVEVGESALNDLWVWSAKTGAWREVEPQGDHVPEPRSYHAMTSAGGRLFLFGGCGQEGRLADFHSFDPLTSRWEQLPSPPGIAGRGGATLEAAGDLICLFSGFEGKESRDYLSYSIADREWVVHDKPEIVSERSVCASFALPSGKVVVFGGEVSPSERGHDGAGGFSKEVFLLDPANGSCERIEVDAAGGCPEPRGWGSGCRVSGNVGAFFGGLTGSDSDPRRLGDAWGLEISE